MVEVMVVVVLMSFIVLALMAVFNSTQQAFRASMTQTDVLEGGRSAIDMMTTDLRQLTPSFKPNTVNFGVTNDPAGSWLTTSMIGTPAFRTNVTEMFFILTRGNDDGHPVWGEVAYGVAPVSSNGLYSLYRFSTNHHEMARDPRFLFRDFTNFAANVSAGHVTNGAHLIDGVVHLAIHAYDTNGVLISSNIVVTNIFGAFTNVMTNVYAGRPQYFQGTPFDRTCLSYVFYSNAVPATVEIEMAVLENRVLQRAESRPAGPARDSYLLDQAGKIHVFRQRVTIPSANPAGF